MMPCGQHWRSLANAIPQSAWNVPYGITCAERPAKHSLAGVYGSEWVAKMLKERGDGHPKSGPLKQLRVTDYVEHILRLRLYGDLGRDQGAEGDQHLLL
jgi:hypothetical protein